MTGKSTNGNRLQSKGLSKNDRNHLIAGGIAGINSMTWTHPLHRVNMMRVLSVKEIANKNIFQ